MSHSGIDMTLYFGTKHYGGQDNCWLTILLVFNRREKQGNFLKKIFCQQEQIRNFSCGKTLIVISELTEALKFAVNFDRQK